MAAGGVWRASSSPVPLLQFGREKKKKKTFFLVLFPRHEEGPACLPWKREDLEPWLCFK